MGQVGTSWSTWDKWDEEKGFFRSSWDKWDKDKGSVHLNHSTCPKWDYKAVQNSLSERPPESPNTENVDITTEIRPDARKFSFGIALLESALT